jgi:peptide/nickel transport system ATP-binding protein
MTEAGPVLQVEDLSVDYRTGAGLVAAIRGVSLAIASGEAVGLVGESGSGKTTLGMAIMRYLPANGQITGGCIRYQDTDLVPLTQRELSRIRGNHIAMVYQDPSGALNPSLRAGEQIAEVYRAHLGLNRDEARGRAEGMLELVGLPEPHRAYDRYPHQFSGGQKQRIVISMALAMDPNLLILDEPTTGLDVTVESDIMQLFADLRAKTSAAILFISHDIGLVASVCERVGVLYRGELVETGDTEGVFTHPTNPYTRGLLACRVPPGVSKDSRRLEPLPSGDTDAPVGACLFEPRCAFRKPRCREQHPALYPAGSSQHSRCFFHEEVARAGPPTVTASDGRAAVTGDGAAAGDGALLEVRGLRKVFRAQGRDLVAVADAAFTLGPGRILGIVGESGSGKTTLARMIAGLEVPDDGEVILSGVDVTKPANKRSVASRRSLQMVFQHPDGTLNPSHRIRQILRRQMRKLDAGDVARHDETLAELLRAVQLGPEHLDARPRELSGGQQQRVAIARAFCTGPQLVILDEPTSSLDVSVQAAILNLLIDLQRREQASYLLISHDLAVVRYLADDILVMHDGEIVEYGPAADVFESPQDPYTRTLLSAVTARVGQAPLAAPATQPETADEPRMPDPA